MGLQPVAYISNGAWKKKNFDWILTWLDWSLPTDSPPEVINYFFSTLVQRVLCKSHQQAKRSIKESKKNHDFQNVMTQNTAYEYVKM